MNDCSRLLIETLRWIVGFIFIPVLRSFLGCKKLNNKKYLIMLKTILTGFLSLMFAFSISAQKLVSFTDNLKPEVGTNSYLSITQKKTFSAADAKMNKANIDLALVITKSGNSQILEWYNLNGKDDKIPNDMIGTNTGIASLTFDKEQFEKCNTSQDLQRMTGYITNNSFVHFGSITDDMQAGVKYHCFLIQNENGKKALLWIEDADAGNYKVLVKMQ